MQATERLDEKIKKSGTSTLDTVETLPQKMEIAEIMAEIEHAVASGDFPDTERKMIYKLIMNARMKYRIQSGIYTAAEMKIAEREKP
jgi:hypothetical protein